MKQKEKACTHHTHNLNQQPQCIGKENAMSESGSIWRLSPRRPTRTRRTHQSNNQPGGQVELAVLLAGLPARPCHHPCRSAECRACKSGQQDDPPGPATAQAGPQVLSSRLIEPPGPTTTQVTRQSAKSASPASWKTRRAPPRPRPGGRVPSGLLVYPPCTITAQVGRQNAERASPVSRTTRRSPSPTRTAEKG